MMTFPTDDLDLTQDYIDGSLAALDEIARALDAIVSVTGGNVVDAPRLLNAIIRTRKAMELHARCAGFEVRA